MLRWRRIATRGDGKPQNENCEDLWQEEKRRNKEMQE